MRPLITDTYRQMQAELHAAGNYGMVGALYGPLIGELLRSTGATSLLDYGCGSQQSMLRTLELPPDVVYEGYDPAIPAFSAPPVPAELVCCIDVLEHIEPAYIDNVMEDLASLCDPYGFFTIQMGPAEKTLPDGRNAHLIQETPEWWHAKLARDFTLLVERPFPGGFCVLVHSKRSETPARPGAAAPMAGFTGRIMYVDKTP